MCTIKMYATGDVVQLFAAEDYLSRCALVNYRVKQFVYTCIRAVHHNRLVLFVLNSLTFGPLAFLNFLPGCYFHFSLLFFLRWILSFMLLLNNTTTLYPFIRRNKQLID